MRDVIAQVLANRWAEYERLRRAGAEYSALVRLGEIDNCLRFGERAEPLARKWHTALEELRIPEEFVAKASAEAQRNLARLQHMLSVGTTFTYEELLLAITMRVELDMAAEFLGKRGIAAVFDARSVDEDLLRVAGSARNSSAFGRAQAAARRNWGIPLKSRWLGEGTEH